MNIALRMKKKKIDSVAPAGRVTTHDKNILPITLRFSAPMPLASPTHKTAPTRV